MGFLSFMLPQRAHGVALTGPGTLSVFDKREMQIVDFGFTPDNRLLPLVTFSSSARASVLSSKKMNPPPVLDHLMASRAPAVAMHIGSAAAGIVILRSSEWTLRGVSAKQHALSCIGSFLNLEALSPDGKFLFVNCADGMVLVDTLQDEIVHSIAHCHSADLSVSHDGEPAEAYIGPQKGKYHLLWRTGSGVAQSRPLEPPDSEGEKWTPIEVRVQLHEGGKLRFYVTSMYRPDWQETDTESVPGDFRTCVSVYTLFPNESTGTMELMELEHRPYKKVVKQVQPLAETGRLAVQWAGSEEYLLQIGPHPTSYPQATAPPAAREGNTAWINKNTLFIHQAE